MKFDELPQWLKKSCGSTPNFVLLVNMLNFLIDYFMISNALFLINSQQGHYKKS